MRMRILIVGLLCGWMPNTALHSEEPKTGDVGTPEYKKATDLIRQLGNPRFTVRELASQQLIAMGRSAKIALASSRNDTDPEVADRCRRILPQAIAADLRARVQVYIQDKDGKLAHDLPELDRYEQLVGKEKEARELYAELIQSNMYLFEALELNPKGVQTQFVARFEELATPVFDGQLQGGLGIRRGGSYRYPEAKFGDLAMLFFLGARKDIADLTRNNQMLGQMLWQPPFQSAITSGTGKGIPFRKLFLNWLMTRTDLNSVNQGIYIIQNNKLTEGLPFVVKILEAREQQVWIRAQALACLGQLGTKDQKPAITKLLDDETLVSQFFTANNTPGTAQMKDIALAILLKLSNKDIKEFGFESQPGLNMKGAFFSYYGFGFTSDEKRAAAHKKWKELAKTDESKEPEKKSDTPKK